MNEPALKQRLSMYPKLSAGLAFILLILLITVGGIACSDVSRIATNETRRSQLVGTWVGQDGSQLTFREDGSYFAAFSGLSEVGQWDFSSPFISLKSTTTTSKLGLQNWSFDAAPNYMEFNNLYGLANIRLYRNQYPSTSIPPSLQSPQASQQQNPTQITPQQSQSQMCADCSGTGICLMCSGTGSQVCTLCFGKGDIPRTVNFTMSVKADMLILQRLRPMRNLQWQRFLLIHTIQTSSATHVSFSLMMLVNF